MKTLLLLSLVTGILAGCGNDSDVNAESESVEIEVSSAESVETVESMESVEERPVAYEYEIDPDIFNVVPIADASSEVTLLTFDDAPQEYAMSIAETVKEKDAHAIFFVMGQFLEDPAAKEIIKSIYDMGFEIGNHSYSHPVMTDLTYEEQLTEITKTNELVKEATGAYPRFFRAPHGMFDDNTLAVLNEEAMTNMNWSYGYDWEEQYMDGPALADIMVNTEYLGSGSNLLMHDRSWTAEAVGSIIDGLRAKGYEMVDPALIASPEKEAQ